MMKLKEMTEIYKNILELLENEETSSEMLSIALEQLEDDIEQKADNIAYIIEEINADVEKFKKFEEKLYSKRKTLENKKEYLKRYLYDNMIALDKKKFKTDLFSFNIQKNAPSLKIENEQNIPNEYFKIEKSINKKDLLQDIKNGLEIDGVFLVQSESLRIK